MSGKQVPLDDDTWNSQESEPIPAKADDNWYWQVLQASDPALEQLMHDIRGHALFGPGEEEARFRDLELHHDALLLSPLTTWALVGEAAIVPDENSGVQWPMIHDIAAWFGSEAGARALATWRAANPEAAEVHREWLGQYQTAEPIRTEIVTRNMRFVAQQAHRFRGRGMPLLDLIQEGSMGLMHAVDRFDRHRSVVFMTYAGHWVRQCMSRAVREQGRTIRLPVRLLNDMAKVIAAIGVVGARLGRMPEDKDIAAHLGWPVSRVQKAVRAAAMGVPIELDRPARQNESEGDTIGALIPDTRAVDPVRAAIMRETPRWMEKLFKTLMPKEYFVLEKRGHLGGPEHTLAEVANMLEIPVTRERVRQIEADGLEKARRCHRLHGGTIS